MIQLTCNPQELSINDFSVRKDNLPELERRMLRPQSEPRKISLNNGQELCIYDAVGIRYWRSPSNTLHEMQFCFTNGSTMYQPHHAFQGVIRLGTEALTLPITHEAIRRNAFFALFTPDVDNQRFRVNSWQYQSNSIKYVIRFTNVAAPEIVLNLSVIF